MNAGIHTFRNRRKSTLTPNWAKASPTVKRDPYAAPEPVLAKSAPLNLPTHKSLADIRTDNAPEIERMETLARFYWIGGAVLLSDRYALCAKALKSAPVSGFAPYHLALAELVAERRKLGIS